MLYLAGLIAWREFWAIRHVANMAPVNMVFSSAVVKLALPDLGNSVPPKVYLLVDAQAENQVSRFDAFWINERRATTFALPM